MMDSENTPVQSVESEELPAKTVESANGISMTETEGNGEPEAPEELSPEQRRAMIIGVIVFVLIFVGIIVSIIWLATQPPVRVAHIRDIFIIYMALMSLLISLALVVLMIQLARLTNLLQNEIKPILDSLNETVSNLRGTTVFLSENVTGPVIKLNEYLAGLNQFLFALGLFRRQRKSKTTKGE